MFGINRLLLRDARSAKIRKRFEDVSSDKKPLQLVALAE